MGHKAGAAFFDAKRPWSERKDRILDYYLKPYLAKIATLGRRMVVVDAFAGPGRFKSGQPGSPLIIAERIRELRAQRPTVDCTEYCVEADRALFEDLRNNMAPHPFARAISGTFLDFLPRLEELARTSSVFIYADPFAIDGLEWKAMDGVFRFIENQSVELLLNFNARAFVRRARAALSYEARGDPGDDDDAAGAIPEHVLDRVVGDAWWRTVVQREAEFSADVEAVAKRLGRQLEERFGRAGIYPVRVRLGDSIPKYFLIFASRHPDGLRLINEAVHRDLASEASKVTTRQLSLFGGSPEELPSVEIVLRPAILELLRDGMTRAELQDLVTRRAFGQFNERMFRNEIKALRAAGMIRVEPDTTVLGDVSCLFRS